MPIESATNSNSSGVKPSGNSGSTSSQWCVTVANAEVPVEPTWTSFGPVQPPGSHACAVAAPPAPTTTSSDTGADGSATGTSTIIKSLTADHNRDRFNPPPHYSSRRISPSALTNYNLTDLNSSQKAGLENAISGTKSFNRRGFIIQDPDTAVYQNGAKSGSPKAVSDLWGFQFMYNPTTISHSNSSTTAYDLTNTDDVANLMVGSQNLSISLLLNRIVDMSALGAGTISGHTATTFPGSAVGYPRSLSVKEQMGILKRGTEFDLEFLYRAVNGDPESNSPTTNGDVNLDTSDFGYLYGSLMWLVLHQHLRYKVYITGISVNHVMFTESMIPTLTEVQLSFARVPAPTFGTATDAANWFRNRNNNASPALQKEAADAAAAASTGGGQ